MFIVKKDKLKGIKGFLPFCLSPISLNASGQIVWMPQTFVPEEKNKKYEVSGLVPVASYSLFVLIPFLGMILVFLQLLSEWGGEEAQQGVASCNPSNLGARGRRITSYRASSAIQWDPLKKERARDLAQWWSTPELNPQYSLRQKPKQQKQEQDECGMCIWN